MTSVALVLLLKQIFLRPWPACCNWILNDLPRTANCFLSARQKNSWVHVSRLKNNTVVFRFLLLVAGADDADCCLLLLEKLVYLARAVYGWNKFRKFSGTRPSVSRLFTALTTAPYLGESFSGLWDVCSLIRRVAFSKNNYKFTTLSRRATMFLTKAGGQRGNIWT